MANTLTLTEEQTEFTPQQRQALEALGIGAIGPGDLAIFLHECQKTGLDPFQKQIYLIRRGDKSTIQVGIDGLQTIARRTVTKTGEAFGEAPILWCGTDGVWRDIWLPLQPPAAAKAVVKRGEGTFTAVALFREFAPMYNGKLSDLWAKMPAHMIGKVAMAHALRQAFPAEMTGVYTDDEMEQAGPDVKAAPVQVQAQPAPQQPKPAQQTAAPVQAKPVQQQLRQTAPVQVKTAAPAQPTQPQQQPAPAVPEAQWAEQMKKKAQAAPVQRQPRQAAPVQGAHWQTHRIDPWAMPAPASTAPSEGEDWRRHVQQPAATKPATKPAQPAAKNAKEGTK